MLFRWRKEIRGASTFYHRACGYSTTLLRCCMRRKETHTPSVLLQCDVMLLQEDGDLCTEHVAGAWCALGVLLRRIKRDPPARCIDGGPTRLCCCNATDFVLKEIVGPTSTPRVGPATPPH